MKNKFFFYLFGTVFMLSQTACRNEPTTDLSRVSFIPAPVSVTSTGDSFTFDETTAIYFEAGQEGLGPVAEYLANSLSQVTGTEYNIRETDELPKEGIYLTLSDEDETIGQEGYVLNIGQQLISVNANGPGGCFYGIQTLLQAIPVKADGNIPVSVATGTIRDFPEFGYRAAMLDVARHFFEVDEVKRFIDLLALYKMNALHLHLTDDQGWRIEIKSWPRLTEIGSTTEVG